MDGGARNARFTPTLILPHQGGRLGWGREIPRLPLTFILPRKGGGDPEVQRRMTTNLKQIRRVFVLAIFSSLCYIDPMEND